MYHRDIFGAIIRFFNLIFMDSMFDELENISQAYIPVKNDQSMNAFKLATRIMKCISLPINFFTTCNCSEMTLKLTQNIVCR